MSDYTDNDGNPITERFFVDPEYATLVQDRELDSHDDNTGLRVVGWMAEGGRYEYAVKIAAMLNEVEELRRDAERYRLLRRGQKWSVVNGAGDELRAEDLDAAIDGAREGDD